MNAILTYSDDIAIAQAILRRNGRVTCDYLYKRCYPLFHSIFERYHTGCATVMDFINDIYVHLMTPSRESGKCPLESYRGESTLTTWLKTASLFYCYKKFRKKEQLPFVSLPQSNNEENDDAGDRLVENSSSIDIDLSGIEREDVKTLIGMMPNERYRKIMTLRYLEQKTNEETAKEVGLSMAVYYNKHKLAREQYLAILKEEDLYE